MEEQQKKSTAEVLVECLKEEGVDTIFSIPGEETLDLTTMFAPITKRTKQIIRPDTVAEITRLAFKYVENEKPGATHIDLPKNIAKMPANVAPLKKQEKLVEYASRKAVVAASELIKQAKVPVILAGNGAVRQHASGALTEFVNRLHIPVVNTMMAKGIVSMDNPYSLWTLGIPQKDYVNKIFEVADLVIGVGYDMVECAPSKWNVHPGTKIIHIACEPADVNKRYQPDVELVGDISNSLQKILNITEREEEPVFALQLKEQMVKEQEEMAADDSYPMKPARILADVRKIMGKEDIVLSDVGAHKMWIARHYHCYEPNTCLISNGFASMGFSVPGAISAKMLYPEQRVLAICGDGGFMMNNQELETAVREKVPFVTLIWEDEAYGLIKWKEQEQFGGSCYVDFTNPDFKMMAESMHCKGYEVHSAQELIPTLEEAFAQKVPAVVVVKVDYSENMKLSARLKEIML